MSEYPASWVSAEIGSLCSLVNGRAFKPSDWTDHGRPIIRIQNLNSADAKFNHFSGQVEGKFLVKNGDLLFAWSGTPGTSFGAHVWNGEQAILNQHIFRVEFPEHLIDKQFFKFAINQRLDELIDKAHGGVGLRHITKGKFEETTIQLPPLAEQLRIVAKLSGLTACTARARAELERVPVLVDHYKKMLLEALYSGDLTNDWRKQQSLPNPKVTRLGDVASDLSYGTSSKSSKVGRVPVLRMGNIQNGELDWGDLVYSIDETEIAKYKLVKGDVLFNRTNSPELVGKTATFDSSREAIFAGYLIRVRCSNRLLPDYLTYCLNSPAGRQYCWRVKSDGVSQSNINATKLADFAFPLPSVQEQTEALKRTQAAFQWLDRVGGEHGAAARLVSHLDQAILAKAFRGELVPQDPADEPASVLLARINAASTDDDPPGRRGRRRAMRSDETAGVTPMLEAAEPDAPVYVAEKPPRSVRDEPHSSIEIDRVDLICRIRRVLGVDGARGREEAIRELADDLGAQRVGSRIREELENGIRTAVRRGILEANGVELRLAARTIEEYDRGFLKDQFLSSLQGRVWTEREDALVQFARWMGYGRTGAAIEDKVRSLIHGLLKEGRLEADGTRIRKV